MAFSENDIQDIKQIVDEELASYLTDNASAIEVEDDVATVQSVEDVEGYMLPMVKISGATYDYKKIAVENFVEDITDEVGRDGVLTAITYDQFNSIFGTSYTPSSSSSS